MEEVLMEKRFTIAIDSNDRKSLWDSNRTEEEPLICLDRFGEIYGIDDCCNLLNELNDKNEQLKFQLKECREHKLFSRRELEKENEQLKQTIENICKDYEEAHGMDIRNAEWFKEW